MTAHRLSRHGDRISGRDAWRLASLLEISLLEITCPHACPPACEHAGVGIVGSRRGGVRALAQQWRRLPLCVCRLNIIQPLLIFSQLCPLNLPLQPPPLRAQRRR